MQNYVPNQPLTILSEGAILCSDGVKFQFLISSRDSRRQAHQAANAHEYEVRQAVQKQSGLSRPLTEREHQKLVRGEPLVKQTTGSVVSNAQKTEEVNPFSLSLKMRRGYENRMSPAYREHLITLETAWNVDHEAKRQRAELESTKEFMLMQEHAKSAYRVVVNDPDSDQVAIRAELLKIADTGDYQKYWGIVAEKNLDANLVKPAAPVAPVEPVQVPTIDPLPPISF